MNSFDALISAIKKEKLPVFFLSPHLDDAVLSCAGLIDDLSRDTSVTVITLFTHAKEPNTFSARRFLQKCHVNDLKALFETRRQEDKNALTDLHANAVHLGYLDGTWRKYQTPSRLRRLSGRFIPEFLHLYPTFLHIKKGKLHREDRKLVESLFKQLRKELPSHAIIFAPLAIGNHVDHVVTREIAAKFADVIFWSDFPYYVTQKPDHTFIIKRGLKKYIYTSNRTTRDSAIRGYTSQLPLLFPNGEIPKRDESFYL